MYLVGLYTYCKMMHGVYNVKYYTLKSFSIKLDYVTSLKYMHILSQSHVTARDMKPGFVDFPYTLSSEW